MGDPWLELPPEVEARLLPGDGKNLQECPVEVPQPLDLRNAVELTLCRNPQTQQAWAIARSQAAQIGVARAGYLPSINLSLTSTEDRVESKTTLSNSLLANGQSASLNWLLLDSGTRSANIEQARQSFAAAMASHDNTIQSVFTSTAQAYYEAWAASAAAQAAVEAENSARENLAAATTKREIGSGTEAERLQTKAALSQAVLAHIRADGARKIAVGTLAANLGLDARSPLQLVPDPAVNVGTAEYDPINAQVLTEFDALIAGTLANHPSVIAAQAQLAAAQAKLSAARSEGLPYLSLNAAQYINGRPNTPLTGSQTDESLTTLTLTVPLFEGYGRNYKIRDAEAQVEAKTRELAAANAQTSLEAWKNYQMLLIETSALAASLDMVKAGQESVDAARFRYQSGATDILEVMSTQKDFGSARQERIRSLSAWRIARLKLLSSLGRLGLWAVKSPSVEATQ
jgi:outer membrane protein